MLPRILTLQNDYSFFLFGPRGAGKSTLLRDRFQQAQPLWLDLLDPEQEARFQTSPNELLTLSAHLTPKSWVVIDEVQRAPRLLNLVHKLIEEKGLLFGLSGSSARKLKRGAANLLAGRAFIFHLHPFCSRELIKLFDLDQALQWGLLPKVVELQKEKDKRLFLQSYSNTYLREEIQQEQIVRGLPTFRKFLEVAAQMNGKPLNFSKVARDIHADHSVVRNYYEILEDTLIGFMLPAYNRSIRKQQRQASKFYFFDCGIKRALDKTLHIPLKPGTYEYGRAFEHFLILEFYKLCDYRQKGESLSYMQTKDDVEVDLILERPDRSTFFIEIKSTHNITQGDFYALKGITEGLKNIQAFILSRDPQKKSVGAITAYPWESFLELFAHDQF